MKFDWIKSIIVSFLEFFLKLREHKETVKEDQRIDNIKIVKSNEKIKTLYSNTVAYARALWEGNFGVVKGLFRNGEFDIMCEILSEADFQFYLSKETLQIWELVFQDMGTVYENQENWLTYKRNLNSNIIKSSSKETEFLRQDEVDKKKLFEDVQKLRNCEEFN